VVNFKTIIFDEVASNVGKVTTPHFNAFTFDDTKAISLLTIRVWVRGCGPCSMWIAQDILG